ncbi:amino acid ABC transporter permease [Nisaea acidiphila]|uniref:Amino acid ABC transporter permease n=1 Tax=Nisaea acidiphila TaxID=1862145 RepID=A0A9J7AWV8_9PROT|nr:amino acid ABC transporter permease [Nisaea acidiphila]UUX49933.1 amino acid ABC transporter permease [Nisaea acidiphila]
MDELIYNFFNIDIMKEVFPLMLRGAGMTLLLCVAVIPLGLLGGLLVALATRTNYRTLRYAVIALIDLFRAVPPLVLLIFVYAGLPFAGVDISPFTAVCIAFLLNNSAYFAEIYRAGIDSIGVGQFEAARSTGLSGIQTMRYVILPQATRNVLPDVLSNTIEIVKLTSIASVVSFQELLYSADMARSVTYNASPIVMAAIAYLLMLWPVVRLLSRMEHRVGQ